MKFMPVLGNATKMEALFVCSVEGRLDSLLGKNELYPCGVHAGDGSPAWIKLGLPIDGLLCLGTYLRNTGRVSGFR